MDKKPDLPRAASYRHPDTGKFIKRQEWEELAQEGKHGQITMSAAISNKQIKEYVDKLGYQSFGQGMAQSYERPDNSGIKSEELEKLFDTIANKIITKIGGIGTTVAEFKKQSDQQGTKLINLSTSMYAAITSQKDTINELYKLIDKRMESIFSKPLERASDQEGKSDQGISKTAGIIRGLGGLNKQLVELNKTVASKVFPTLLAIQKSLLDGKSAPKTIEVAKPTAATPVQETEKIEPSKSIQKKDEKSAYSATRMETASTGLLSILGGTGIMAIGAAIDSFTSKFDSFGELAKSISKGAEDIFAGVSKTITELEKSLPDAIAKAVSSSIENIIPKVAKAVFPNPTESALDAGAQAVLVPDEKTGELPIVSEAKQFYDEDRKSMLEGADVKLRDKAVDVVSDFMLETDKKLAPASQTSNAQHEAIVLERAKNKQKQAKKANISKAIAEKNIEPIQINPADIAKKQPTSTNIVNKATPNIVNNISKEPLSSTTVAVKESTLALNAAQQQKTGLNSSNQPSQVSVSNQTNNNQHVGILNNPSARNSESSKTTLDRMSLFGSYNGAGFLVN